MSSDDSDDDDLLLLNTGLSQHQKPKTTNSTRLAEKKEKKLFSFLLDDIVVKEQRRFDTQERIDRTIKEDENKEGTVGDTTTTNTNTNTTVDNYNHLLVVDNNEQIQQDSIARKKPKYDINDPAYWENVESYTSKSTNHHNPKNELKFEDDELDGHDDIMEDYDNMHPTDNELQYCDDDTPTTTTTVLKDRKKAYLDAILIGRSTHLGVRQIFFGKHQDSSSNQKKKNTDQDSSTVQNIVLLSPFETENDAMNHLHDCLNLWESCTNDKMPDSVKQDPKLQGYWNYIMDSFITFMRISIEKDMLTIYLDRVSNVSCLPLDIFIWLVNTSISGCSSGSNDTTVFSTKFTRACHKLATKVLRLNIPLLDREGGTLLLLGHDTNKNDTIPPFTLFRISDFIRLLEDEFGMWTKEGKPATTINSSNNSQQHQQQHKSDDSNVLDNEIGLRHTLELWSVAVEGGFMTWNGDDELSYAISILMRASLDPIFHSGEGLIKTVTQVIKSIFIRKERSVDFQSVNIYNNVAYSNFLSITAEKSLKSCMGLSAGAPNTADEDDIHGWLPLSLAARNVSFVGVDNLSVIIFFNKFALFGISECIKNHNNVQNFKDCLLERAKRFHSECGGASGDKSLTTYEFLSTLEVVLQIVPKEVMDDGPLFLNLVQLASLCTMGGLSCLQRYSSTRNSDTLLETESSEKEANVLCDYYEQLEIMCNYRKKQIVSVFSSPHLRRTKELLSHLAEFYHHRFNHSCKLTRRDSAPIAKKQNNLNAWITKSRASDVKADSSEEESDVSN